MTDALPDLPALAATVDALLGVEPAPTALVRPRAGPVAGLGLALEPWPGLARWAADAALDAVLLHRHRALRPGDLPAPVGVLANHDAFDRRLGFGRSPELAAALGVALGPPLGERDGFPLATLGDGPPRPVGALRALLVAAFGGVEAELEPAADVGPVTRVAMARAMTPALVEGAAAAGARAYVTGQLRAPAREAARRAGVHVLAVGHRASERWALARLAAGVRAAWPALDVRLAPDDAPVPRGR